MGQRKRLGYAQADTQDIITSNPVNKTAALVTAKGEHWEPPEAALSSHLHSDTPLPTATPEQLKAKHQEVPPLAGTRVNRLTVIGIYQPTPESNQQKKWVVRCDCGSYEIRTAKAIKRQLTPSCMLCQYSNIQKVRHEVNNYINTYGEPPRNEWYRRRGY